MSVQSDNAEILRNALKLVDDAVIKYHESNRREYSEKIHVTEVTGCLRRAYFHRTVNLPPDANYFTFMGTAIHDALLSFIAEETEVKVENDILIGYADAIIEINGERYVFELKTVRRLPSRPYPSHVEQVNAYMNILDII